MRDKYVRLRKQDRMRAPIKETDKWYNYYQKMSFLDPYIEHRNRKRQMDRASASHIQDDDELLLDEINSMKKDLAQDRNNYHSLQTSSSSSSSGNTPNSNLNSPDQEMNIDVKRLAHPYNNRFDGAAGNNKVSLFIRIVSQALSNMDRRDFEKARLEISKVLHKIDLDN
ncbi:hypothetical protein CRE_19963 [Caenorhabditis remanei]|uniref:MADF domain-containing protein n=1 Tax=Caenorhabditis remanei TaxID=31234 RepID=E3N8F1_CAERE|nr:hypothetical protein CRE_19963 [Caenorhabditis remanei]